MAVVTRGKLSAETRPSGGSLLKVRASPTREGAFQGSSCKANLVGTVGDAKKNKVAEGAERKCSAPMLYT